MSDIYIVFIENMDGDRFHTLDEAIDAMKHAFSEGAVQVLIYKQEKTK